MSSAPQHRIRLIAAFAAVYVVWGSTYLAIRFAIETLPPFLMAGVRFIIAGIILWTWARFRGAAKPTRAHWGATAIVGALLLLGGNGAVVWAEQRVPSGLAALFSLTPFWMVLFDWIRPGGVRPTPAILGGLLSGFIGLIVLVDPVAVMHGGSAVDPGGMVALTIGSLAWASGSIYIARGARLPESWVLATGMEMVFGGILLVLASLLTGEYHRLAWQSVSTRSLSAFFYLITFGAIIGYSAYIYLLRHTTPVRASTYAYVNPMIAVLLGWLFAGEPLTGRVLIAAVGIVGAVALITSQRASATVTSAAEVIPDPAAAEPTTAT